ncbi:MAG TPA: hypothetical protein EYQ54_19455 [Myxococcales bacterium]|nr:hypothetical protein [Myxococcales bacterium]HIL80814.1 hypothetical protein [Myxococcales bacterium]
MVRATALVLTLLTGFSGLVYEVAWQRYLATLLGSHSEATAAVLGIFLGGLSVGYWLFGRITRRVVERAESHGVPPRLLLVYGAVEAGIGLYVLAFPWFFSGVQWVSYAIPHTSVGLGFLTDVALAILLIGPASILMGGTIPILTQGLARSLDDATRFHAFVYGFNTVGAFAGALAAGFYLIPVLGLVDVMFTMGIINLVAGAIFVVLGLRGGVVSSAKEELPALAQGGFLEAVPYLAVALLTGFAMMTVQTTLIRLGGLSFGSSQFTFSMVVAVFVLCIAVGSFLVSALSRITPLFAVLNQWALAVLLLLLYAPLEDSPYWAHFIRSLFRDETAGFGFYYLFGFLSLLCVVGLPVVLSGASLPILFHQMRRDIGHLGDIAGNLYSWNTVGSLLGALIGGYTLFFWFDLHHVYRIAVVALFLAALLLTIRLFNWRRVYVLLIAPLIGLVVLLPPWDPAALNVGLFRVRQPIDGTSSGPSAFREASSGYFDPPMLFHTDDPIASVTVREYKRPGGLKSLSIVTNGKSDSNTFQDYTTVGLLATLPALMARKAERAFVIGWGTGITAGELASLDSMTTVDVAEISPGVLQAAPLFDFANMNASRNPKIHVIQSDAYRALMRSEDLYDLIISEPSNPWVTGVEMLYSREFLSAARERLAEGGVYAQWIHQYEIDDETLALVLRTYAEVFEHIALWGTASSDLLLLGLDEPGSATDHFRLESRAARRDFAQSLKRIGITSFPALLAHELIPVGVIHAADLQGPIHTLYHPRLNDKAGRSFFRGDFGNLPFFGYGEPARLAKENSMLRGYALRFGGSLPDEERAQLIRETLRSATPLGKTLFAQWMSENPNSVEFDRLSEWLDQVRSSSPHSSYEQAVDRVEPEQLVQFFQRRLEISEDITPPRASKKTDQFLRFYHHAAPFDGDQLLRVWGSCREGRNDLAGCRKWAHDAALGLDSKPENELLEECLSNRHVGAKCREGLAGAHRLLETGTAQSQ